MARLARRALSAGAASLLTRATGLVREVVFAAVFGATMQTDALHAAMRVPNLFRDLFAEGSMANAFVPNFADAAEKEGIDSAWRLANALLGVLTVALGLLTAAIFLFADTWVWVVAAGFQEVPGKAELTATLVRWVSPFLAMVSAASLFGGMLNVRGRFFLPALAPAAFNIAIVLGCLVPTSWQQSAGLEPMITVAIAATVGGALQALVQLPALWREGFRLRPTLAAHPHLRRLLAFLAPALIGIGTVQIGILIDQQIAASMGDGPVSWLRYAFQLAQLPMNLFASAIAVAGMATLSTLVARGKRDDARAALVESLGLTSFLVLPSAVGLYLLAEPIVSLFFQRGAFTAHDTAVTAGLVQAYALGVLAFGAHRVVVPAFYAWADPWTPMVLGVGALVLKVPLALWWSDAAWFDLQGIPLAHAAVASVEVALLVLWLRVRTGPWRGLFGTQLRVLVATAGMTAALLALRPWLSGALGTLALVGISALLYFFLAAALGLTWPRALLRRLLRPAPAGLPPHVDAPTRLALAQHAGSKLHRVERVESELLLHTSAGTLRLRAVDGQLLARCDEVTPFADVEPWFGVLDLAHRPPPLKSLRVGPEGSQRHFTARADRVDEAEHTGPVIVLLAPVADRLDEP